MLAGIPGDRFGRRDSLRVLAVLYLISALGCAFAWDWTALVVFRFIGGLGIGGSSVLGPMYIAEVAPAKWRGRLVGLFQFNVVLGILLAYLSNYIVGAMQLGAAEWRWKLGIPAAPALLFFLLLFTIPRSPRWLVKKQRVDEAKEVLRVTGEENYEQELQEIVTSIDAEHIASDPLFSWKYRLPIFLAVSIGMFNQLSGINAILYYLNDIFAYAGFNKVSSDLQAVAIGATNLVFTMLAMSMIDRVGRKTLLLIGSVGTAACLGGVAAIFLSGRHQDFLVWLLRLLRVLARRRHLGLSERSFPQPRARQRTKPRQLFALVYERAHLTGFPVNGGGLRRLSVHLFRGHDGSPVFCCPVRLSGNQRNLARRDAKEARYRLTRKPRLTVVHIICADPHRAKRRSLTFGVLPASHQCATSKGNRDDYEALVGFCSISVFIDSGSTLQSPGQTSIFRTRQ
jgi:MFS family permease